VLFPKFPSSVIGPGEEIFWTDGLTEQVDYEAELAVRCRVNGETVQSSSTREMVFSVAQIIAFISDAITLDPGDVILTGTPDGVGYFCEPQLFLAPGDEVEVEIGDFGVLANPVGAPLAAPERVR
jgi:2-keto-4-pentenoate hydratase/2-oxohepta-3-ene-1,7-dioic acid hydratase in catechol pathway